MPRASHGPRFAPALVEVTPRPGGGVVLRSPRGLGPYGRCLGDLLARWAREAPDRTFLAERDQAGGWRRVSYAETHAAVRAIAQSLLDLGAVPERPVLLLSDNAIDHALVQLAAMHVGVPAAPVSPAYSLQSTDLVKLRGIAALLGPSVVYADSGAAYARAIDALELGDTPVVVSAAPRPGAVLLDDLRRTAPGDQEKLAAAAVTPDTIAKVLFTSGSTGTPKGIVNTQRMLCSNQQAIAQLWPFLDDRPPVIVDWLPWSHTFGGNHNFDMILRHGGTLYIDGGKPTPGRIEATVANLREISPTLYFNVPRGFDMLLPFLEDDAALRETFFRELDLLFYAAAALPQNLWERLEKVSARARGAPVTMVSAWGSTETAPMATSVHFPIPRAGVIGLPAPGCSIALVPEGDKLEMRVRGPNVTPGSWELGGVVRPAALDADGYLSAGDAGRLEDPHAPEKGLVFDGRTSENFKLSSGTWVAVGALRLAIVSACSPLVQDAVITAPDHDELGVLLFPNPTACLALGKVEGLALAEVVRRPEVRERIAAALAAHNRLHRASSMRIGAAAILVEPPSIDGGEITDKGYINQRATLERRKALVDRLYAGGEGVIEIA